MTSAFYRSVLLSIVLMFMASAGRAQPAFWSWALGAGSAGPDMGRDVTTDAHGNVYITGSFSQSVLLEGEVLGSAGKTDVYVAKFDPFGSLVWARRAGGTEADAGSGVAVDAAGNVYVTGTFKGTAYFGTQALTSAGEENIFLASYAPDGSLRWAKRAGGTDEESVGHVGAEVVLLPARMAAYT